MGSKHQDSNDVDDDFLQIEVERLPEHWVEQPRLFYRYARRLALSRSKLDECSAQLKLVQAQLDAKIRQDPSEYDLVKVTDKAVEAAIPLQKEYRAALDEFNEVKRRVSLLDAAVQSLEHRKRALEKLVDLASMEWFSTPRASKESKEAMDMVEKRAVRRKQRRDDE